MPLIKSSSNSAFKTNLKAELAAGRPQKQALAIAYDVQRRNRSMGGLVTEPGNYALGGLAPGTPNGFMRAPPLPSVHTGPISGPTGGRTDARPLAVPSGAYVVPADIVSHLGDGNTGNGMRVLDNMFKSGPYGVKPNRVPGGRSMGIPRPPRVAKFAEGGLAGAPPQEPVDIFAADGEYVIPPEVVGGLGSGDMKKGHEYLDSWVTFERKKAIKTLQNLPGPVKN